MERHRLQLIVQWREVELLGAAVAQVLVVTAMWVSRGIKQSTCVGGRSVSSGSGDGTYCPLQTWWFVLPLLPRGHV